MSQDISMDDRIRAIEDREAIHALIVKSCFLIDRKRFDLMAREIFSEDAVVDYGMAIFRGRAEIDAFYTGYDGNLLGSSHNLTNVLIEVAGDTARAASYVQAWHWHNQVGPETALLPTDIMVVGGYQDKLVRNAGGWRICERITVQFGTGVGAGAPTPPIKPVLEGMLGRLPTWPEFDPPNVRAPAGNRP